MIKTCINVIFFGLMFSPLYALAHKVNVFASINNSNLQVEAYFPDGKKAKSSKVTAFNKQGKIIFEGITDDQGKLSAALKNTGEIKIVVDAGLGHSTQTVLVNSTEEIITEPLRHDQVASEQQLAQTIETAVRKAVLPLERQIAQYQNRTTLREVIGGIGYLAGLFGLIAYFQAKKYRQNNE